MNKVIQFVNPEVREWQGPKGTIWYVSGQFTDGDQFSSGTKSPEKRVEELEALIGVEHDFNLERRDDYNGTPQWKLTWGNYNGGGGDTELLNTILAEVRAIRAALAVSSDPASVVPTSVATSLGKAGGGVPNTPPATDQGTPGEAHSSEESPPGSRQEVNSTPESSTYPELLAENWALLTQIRGSRVKARGWLTTVLKRPITASNEAEVTVADLEMAINATEGQP